MRILKRPAYAPVRLGWLAAILISCMWFPSAFSSAQVPQPFHLPSATAWRSAQKNLDTVKGRQSIVVAQLFALAHQVSRARTLAATLQTHAERAAARLKSQKAKQAAALLHYQADASQTSHLLRLMQYLGPASYIGVVLGSTSFADFTHQVGATTLSLQLVQAKLVSLRADLTHLNQETKTTNTTAKRYRSAASAAMTELTHLHRLQAKAHSTLQSLGSQRSHFAKELSHLQTDWIQVLRPYFTGVARAFSALPQTTSGLVGVKTRLTTHGVDLIVSQSSLNRFLHGSAELQDLRFSLHRSRSTLSAADKQLALKGAFGVIGGDALVFRVQSAAFSGIPLNLDLVRSAMNGQGVQIDLSPLIRPLRLIAVTAGHHRLTIRLGAP